MNKPVQLMLLMMTLLVLSGGVACTSEPASTLDEAAVRAYADAATETCLQGLSEGDLTKYTIHANADFKAAVTQEVLDATAATLEEQLGAFQSCEYLRAEEDEGYVIVHYRATYAKAKVGVRMVFDEDQLIAGQWFE